MHADLESEVAAPVPAKRGLLALFSCWITGQNKVATESIEIVTSRLLKLDDDVTHTNTTPGRKFCMRTEKLAGGRYLWLLSRWPILVSYPQCMAEGRVM